MLASWGLMCNQSLSRGASKEFAIYGKCTAVHTSACSSRKMHAWAKSTHRVRFVDLELFNVCTSCQMH